MRGEVVVSQEQIGAAVQRLASQLAADLQGRRPVFIGVLKGCIYFFCDLTQAIARQTPGESGLRAPGRDLEIDFIQATSYGASTTSSGTVVLIKDITVDVRDRDVYLVEDIVDTGTTLADLIELIRARHPRSLQVVSLLSKPSRRQVEVDIDYLGMEIDDQFVVGYGLDFAEQYRHLPDIHVLERDSDDTAEEP